MINLKNFLDEFKKTLSNPRHCRSPLRAHFVIEFQRSTSAGETEWYSPLLVVRFLEEDTLHFHYTAPHGERKPTLSDLAKNSPSPFKYYTNWNVVELVPPVLREKTIVRIKPN